MSEKFTPEEIAEIKPGPIAWMATHPVAANLLMLIFLLGGFYILTQTTKEVFPEFSDDSVNVRMAYPGASPEEVEQAIILAVEDGLKNIEGIGEVRSTASEGMASVIVEILDLDEEMRVLQDVKTALDRITTFPVEAEDLAVYLSESRVHALQLVLYGDTDEFTLRQAADILRDTLEANPDIGPVELSGIRDFEIHIEISQENLRRYGLSLQEVAALIRSTALELGGGSIRSEGGEILVRMSERRNDAREFEDIPVIALDSGAQVFLGDIASLKEGFDNTNKFATFEGQPAVLLTVKRVGKQTPGGVTKAVLEELSQLGATLPAGIKVSILEDAAKVFNQRAELLMRNGLWGLLLVVILLALFLDLRLAFWVAMGIPISFMGAFLLFPATDFSINMISMFAFIITLGIVVDDAVVSGENIYHFRQKGYSPLKASVEGAREIALPVTVSIITNIVAFVPLFFVPGIMGKILGVMPIVVIAAFLVSLVESLFILPAHLTFPKAPQKPANLMERFLGSQKGFNARFEEFIAHRYGPFLERVIAARYFALSIFVTILIVMGGFVASGRVGLTLFPSVESDFAFAAATLKSGSSLKRLESVRNHISAAARSVISENGGAQLSTGIFTEIKDNVVEVRVNLTDPEIRPIGTSAFTALWRKQTGEIPGLESLSFAADRDGPGAGEDFRLELSHRDTEVLDQAAKKVAAALREFPVVRDIDDGAAQGKKQYDFTMKELGYTLGFTSADVARQVRDSFYGSEVLKQQRGRHEVRVLVRLPEEERESEYTLKNLILRAPDGREVLLRDVVQMQEGRAFTTIERRDGRRIIEVSADIEPQGEAGGVIGDIQKNILPDLQQRYPGLSYSFEGQQAEIRDSITSLLWGLFAVLFVMYALLAVLFGSYIQPLMIMLAIPFGAVGAVVGHFIMGYSLSIMSLFGLMALTGVVVNDSLILIEFANRRRKEMEIIKAVIDAGIQRFRPIILTTLTTFAGLMPMIFETSRQARFLIPMALSLGFGVLFATTLTLILIPALYMIIEDLKRLFRAGFGSASKQTPES